VAGSPPADEDAAATAGLAQVIEANDGDDPGYVVMEARFTKRVSMLLDQMDACA
jgi:hypothetical protein